jgi:hypothetical protein
MKKRIKKIVLIFSVFGFFFVFNSGLRFDSWESLFQTLVFTAVTLFLIFQPWIKKVFVILSLILFIFMVIFFTLCFISVAELFGSLGFGIFIISVLFYLPGLLKYGHI